MNTYTFRDLRIYKKAIELVVCVYALINKHSSLSRDFSMCDQLKSASVSVVATIAEGYFRSKKQCLYYLDVASGSANEMIGLLEVTSAVHHVQTEDLIEEYVVLGKQINAYAKSI